MTVRGACVLGVLTAILSVTGCGDSPTSPSELAGRVWRLVSIEPSTGPSTVITDQSRYWVEFLGDTRLSARADCNTCTGSYTLSGTTVAISGLACTRAFCGETSLDTVFMQGLTEAHTLTLDDQLLEIESPARTLKFRPE